MFRRWLFAMLVTATALVGLTACAYDEHYYRGGRDRGDWRGDDRRDRDWDRRDDDWRGRDRDWDWRGDGDWDRDGGREWQRGDRGNDGRR